MTAHDHRTFIEGCFRCDLNLDEMHVPPHECDTGNQDRVLCPEPCGKGHVYCSVCDRLMDECTWDVLDA